MSRIAKNLAFNVPAREGEAELLDKIAHRAGFPTWQALFRHIKDRLETGVADKLDPYPEIDQEIRTLVDRVSASMVAKGRRPS
jgi:hypothetical protein